MVVFVEQSTCKSQRISMYIHPFASKSPFSRPDPSSPTHVYDTLTNNPTTRFNRLGPNNRVIAWGYTCAPSQVVVPYPRNAKKRPVPDFPLIPSAPSRVTYQNVNSPNTRTVIYPHLPSAASDLHTSTGFSTLRPAPHAHVPQSKPPHEWLDQAQEKPINAVMTSSDERPGSLISDNSTFHEGGKEK